MEYFEIDRILKNFFHSHERYLFQERKYLNKIRGVDLYFCKIYSRHPQESFV